MSEKHKDKLPPGWVTIRLKDICEVVRGGSPRPMGDPKYFDGDIPFIKIGDITKIKSKVVFDSVTKVNEEGAKKSRLLPKGSLILSNSGTVCVPKFLGTDACIHDGFVSFLDLPEEISKDFLFYYFDYLRPSVVQQHKQGVTQVNLNTEIVKLFNILLPPSNEQHRIVAKIEELFSELDNGIENLKKAQAQLKIYRQAVLKYAFEGKLTAAWRQQNADKLEPAEQLLKRIKAERESYYNRQLEEWRQAVKEWEKDGKKGKKLAKPKAPKELPPLTEAELAELPTLPEGWGWVRLGEISENVQIGPFGTQLHKSDYIANGIPIINPVHIKDSKIIANKNLTIAENKYRELQNYVLRKGDIIMGRRGEMGRCALVTDRESGWLCGTGSLFIRPISSVNAQYLSGVLSSREIKSFLEREASGSTMSNLNLKILYRVPISLSPFIEEQTQIVQEIESRLSVCDKLEETIEESLKKAELLRQSILKKAFEGKLVPQDPNDEPAEKLLARILQEKEFTLKKNNQKGV